MKTKNKKVEIFYYKGYIGIDAQNCLDFDNEQPYPEAGMINNPFSRGQLGFLFNIDEIQITEEAVKALQDTPKSNDSLGDLMCFDKTFGWLGGPLAVFNVKDNLFSRDCDSRLLLDIKTTELEVPEDFKTLIESYQE